MAKTLISWLAVSNDFSQGKVNEQGPTISYHTYYYQYDRHLILYTDEGYETQAEFLKNYIEHKFENRAIELKLVPLTDIIDLQEVKGKSEAILLEYNQDDIDIFFSLGTSTMSLAWYICHTTLGLNTRLIQMRKPRFTKDQEKPELLVVDVSKDPTPASAMIKQLRIDQKESQDYCITPSIQKIYGKAYKVSQADHVSVMIYGESGTGKEHLAQYIHKESPRKNRAFRALNCAAFTDTLLSSQLFGHKKGAFTGAYEDKKGLFEVASGGTLFLDEIGDISQFMQQSLLRVLQEGEILPLGSSKIKKVDVRIIAATNRNLVQRCKEGAFRWDLYYRLAVVELKLPPLAERGISEIQEMVDFFIRKKKELFRRNVKIKLSPEARKKLLAYPFPGNVRELENIVEHLYVFCQEKVHVEDLPEQVMKIDDELSYNWKVVEKYNLIRAWKHFDHSKMKTLRAVGYKSLNTLKKKLADYEIINN